MKIGHGNLVNLIVVVAVVAAVVLSQSSCRRAGDEPTAEGPDAPAGRSQVQDVEKPALESTENQFPAVDESADLSEQIEQCHARLKSISSESGETQKKVAAARRRVRSEDAKIAALIEEAADLREMISEKMHSLPGTQEKLDRREELQQELQELQEQRRGLVARAKEEDPRTLQAEAKKIGSEIRANIEEMRNVSMAIEKARREARRSDPDIKSLSAELVEKERAIEAKIASSPEVKVLIEKRTELKTEARKMTKRIKALRETLVSAAGE